MRDNFPIVRDESFQNKKTIYLFTGGTGRSGTTIMGKLLNKHPEIRVSKPVEIKFLSGNSGLLDLTYGLREFIEMKKSRKFPIKLLQKFPILKTAIDYQRFHNKITGHWWMREKRPGKGTGLSSGLDHEVLVLALKEYKSNRKINLESAAQQFLSTMVVNQKNNHGEQIWVDTSPPNIMNADRIHQLFPEAKFINMVRDGRNTIASVLKEHWGPNDPIKAIHWWKNRIRMGHRALSKIPSNLYLNIQLEELTHFDRERQYQKIIEFLEIEDDQKMRNFFDEEVDGLRVMEKKWEHEISHPRFQQVFEKASLQLESEGIQIKHY